MLEQQTQPDQVMILRLISYMLEVWELQKREWADQNIPPAERRLTPVVPFVFYVGRRTWNAPLAFRDMFDVPPGFERFIPSWETLFLNLHKTPPKTLTGFVNAIGWALRTLKSEKASYAKIEQTLKEATQGLEGLTEEQRGQWERIMTFLGQLIYYRRTPEEGRRLMNLLKSQARRSKFFKKDEARLAEQEREWRSSVEETLTYLFGVAPGTNAKALNETNFDTLTAWWLATFSAKTLAEVGIEGAN